MKIELVKNGNEVYYNDMKVHINPQASKNYPVVDLAKLGFDDYQRYVALNSLKEGLNVIELKPRKQVATGVVLTEEEKAQIAELEAKIEEIKENARKRTPKKKRLEDMTIEELEEYIKVRKGE